MAYHVQANVLNDIENGLDVPDEEIEKAFPFKRNPVGPDFGVKPDSMPDDYHRKLDAIREKKAKEKDLKAKPADKK